MDRLTSMTVFARVAGSRSFSGAARELGISQATASKHVQMLEDWVGVRLLHRTTRRVALTTVGESFLAESSRILEALESTLSATKPDAPLRGSMRITAPVAFGSTRLGPMLVDYMRQHPELSVSTELSDRATSLVEEGFDLAIRVGPIAGSGLVSWPLMPLDYVLCAAPSYLYRHGVPGTPEDLGSHHCIMRTEAAEESWRFDGPEGHTEVPIRGRLQVNNAVLRRDAARAGAGVLLCADYLVQDDLASGRLVRLLPEHTPQRGTLHAVSPAHRAGSPKVVALVNHLTAELGDPEEPSPQAPSRAQSGEVQVDLAR